MSASTGLAIEKMAGGVRFRVKVQARARREEIAGVYDGLLRVRVNAPPFEGRANKAIIALLAKGLQVSRASVKIAAGERARLKSIVVAGVTVSEALARLGLAENELPR